MQIYRGLGLHLQNADNAREAGIYAVWMRLSTGKLKVFRSCRNWFDEFRTFARDENGKIVGESKYHLMAATRYLFLGAIEWWMAKPAKPSEELDYWERLRRSGSYFPRDSSAGRWIPTVSRPTSRSRRPSAAPFPGRPRATP